MFSSQPSLRINSNTNNKEVSINLLAKGQENALAFLIEDEMNFVLTTKVDLNIVIKTLK